MSLSQAARGEHAGGVPWTGTLIPRDALAASCTLAALCLCQVWFCFLATGNAGLFYYQGTSSPKQFAALLADNVLLTGFFAALVGLSGGLRRSRAGKLLSDLTLLLFLIIPGNAIRGVAQNATDKLNLAYWRHASVRGFPADLKISVFGGSILLLTIVVYFHRHVAHIVFRALLILFPLVPFMLAEASWVLLRQHGEYSRNTTLARQPAGSAGIPVGRPGQRLVWIIFDEMDYRLAFESAVNARLTEFNELARQSLHAENAYPPGGRTMVSVPALLSGRLVARSSAANASDLLVRYAGEESSVRWSTRQTVFDLQRQKGWRTAVAGWYFPYSRIFGADVDAWQDQPWRSGLNPNRPFAGLMTDQVRLMAEGKSQALLGKSLTILEHQRVVREVVAQATRKAADPALDLVFLHLPVPHAPFYYDAGTGKEAAQLRPLLGYLDHLQLGDHVLGQIRRALKEAGVAGTTVLLVSSDHWNREADLLDGRMDHRVPFLVNFPGDSRGVRYAAPFNTVLSRRLATAILEGKVRSAAEAAAWIDREKGGLTESPYNGS